VPRTAKGIEVGHHHVRVHGLVEKNRGVDELLRVREGVTYYIYVCVQGDERCE
jgi:hypothetical protein